MSVKYEVSAVIGKYTDREGNEKSRYVRMGVVIEGKHGPMLKIESIPVGWDGWAYLNEPRERDAKQPARQAPRHPSAPADDFDSDSIPF